MTPATLVLLQMAAVTRAHWTTGLDYRHPEIVNGRLVHPSEFPFVVALQYNRKRHCTATILNRLWCLTAAHCFTKHGFAPGKYHVVAGTVDVSKPGRVREVLEVVAHNYTGKRNDVAVIRLAEPLSFDDQVQAALLPEDDWDVFNRTQGTLVGFGRLQENIPTTRLHSADVDVFPTEECREMAAALCLKQKILDCNICGGLLEGGKGQCSGDSGGPLLVDNRQVGIMSWSYKPCTSGRFHLGVLTKVAPYLDWIKESTPMQEVDEEPSL
ncbi:trypsin-1-like isoform X2 [Periplaneta americana]|uniref:trypsin-1-like isoform X2 n=1 Tax=Periplaneta americana TaxID=6978 RepID=UPI0037E94910